MSENISPDWLKIMKAKLKSKTIKEYPDVLVRLSGFYNFVFAYKVNNEKYYEPKDKNWPSSTPIRESDLEIKS